MHYIGLDVHKAFTYGVIEDASGEVVKEDKFQNTDENFSKFLDVTEPKETRIVMESTGVWEFIYEMLEAKGYEVKLANPLRTKAIASARIKTDAVDAKTLADLLRADLIAESYVPSKEMRLLREKVRTRTALIHMRTKTINKIKSILNRQGVKLPWKRWGIRSKKFILEYEFMNKDIVIMYINILTQIEEQVNNVERELEEIAYSREDARLLMTIPGINTKNAMVLISEIADVHRFNNSGQLACYSGLVPGLRQSGNMSYATGLINQANKKLKYVFVKASVVAANTKEANSLQLYYKKLKKKKNKQRALCATARKLATITFAMLKNNKEFIA